MIRYGDPQKRRRLIVQAVKMDLVQMQFPRATHGPNYTGCKKIVTCYDVLDDLAQVDPLEGNGSVELRTKDGKVYYVQNHCKKGTGIKSETEKLKRDEPSHTIRRKRNVEHYELRRTLTIREMAILQSFPLQFQFSGSISKQVSGIGNAVPVKTATAIAKNVMLSMYSNEGNKKDDMELNENVYQDVPIILDHHNQYLTTFTFKPANQG